MEQICGGEGRGVSEPLNVRIFYARLIRRLSIRVTWLLLHTRVTANQVTVIGVLIGLGGAVLLGWNNVWSLLAAVVALQLSFVIDFSDGEVARYRGTASAGGAYLDWIGHYYIPAAVTAALSYAAWQTSGHAWLLLAGLVLIFGQLRIAYSARDHVLLGLYRDYPELRTDPEFVRAVLARQGGDPNRIDPQAEYDQRRAGESGSGVLWHRYTNLGQLFVYPGFVNLVTLAVAIDLIASLTGGDYPHVIVDITRQALLYALALVQLLHQLRATGQSYAIFRRIP